MVLKFMDSEVKYFFKDTLSHHIFHFYFSSFQALKMYLSSNSARLKLYLSARAGLPLQETAGMYFHT